MKTSAKHIHLIGICGTAMASLAGMLKQRGFHVTGSDTAVYPPMSDFLASLAIPVAQPYAEKNLEPRPDLVIIGNAISRGNPELERVLDERIPFQSMPQLLYDEFLRGHATGIEETIAVLVHIDATGLVRDAKVIRGGNPALEWAALDAAKRWRFQAATRNGIPVEADVTIPFRFSSN